MEPGGASGTGEAAPTLWEVLPPKTGVRTSRPLSSALVGGHMAAGVKQELGSEGRGGSRCERLYTWRKGRASLLPPTEGRRGQMTAAELG